MKLKNCWTAVVLLIASSVVRAEDITIAVSSNFAPAMQALVAAFEGRTGHTVKTAYGSSGKFYAQIKNGAPFALFFSGDQAAPQALEQAHIAVPGTRFTYALGALVLWSSDAQRVDQEGRVLGSEQFRRLAIANPKVAPYGTAAVEVLHNLDLFQQLQHKLVLGENIAQTFQFVETANADLGFVALSQLMARDEPKGSAWLVPAHLHQPIRQDAVLLQRGAASQAARSLLQFVRSAEAKVIIERFGYKVLEQS